MVWKYRNSRWHQINENSPLHSGSPDLEESPEHPLPSSCPPWATLDSEYPRLNITKESMRENSEPQIYCATKVRWKKDLLLVLPSWIVPSGHRSGKQVSANLCPHVHPAFLQSSWDISEDPKPDRLFTVLCTCNKAPLGEVLALVSHSGSSRTLHQE